MRLAAVTRYLAITAVSLCVGEAAVEASDPTTMPGSACHGVSDDDAHFYRGSNGSLQNNTALGYSAVCPVVRNNPSTTTGMADAELDFYLESSADHIYCWFYSMDRDGDEVNTEQESYTGASGNHRLDWTTLVDTSSSYGTYTIFCSLPSHSEIFSYVWNEN
jgi:hypothetical protein